MKPSQEEIKAKAKSLHEEQENLYPFCSIEPDVVENYVRSNWSRVDQLTADLLFDYVVSQNLCEVQE